jgi:hypothetical protein
MRWIRVKRLSVLVDSAMVERKIHRPPRLSVVQL